MSGWRAGRDVSSEPAAGEGREYLRVMVERQVKAVRTFSTSTWTKSPYGLRSRLRRCVGWCVLLRVSPCSTLNRFLESRDHSRRT